MSQLTFAFSPFAAWRGGQPCSLPALTRVSCLLRPAELLRLEAPGQHLPPEVVLAQVVHRDGGELDSTGSQPSCQASGASILHPGPGGPEQWLRARGPHKVTPQLTGGQQHSSACGL